MKDPLVFLYPPLSSIDVTSSEVKLYTLIITFISFTAIFFLSYFLSFSFATFKGLRTKEKVFWCLAFVRGIFGVNCTLIGLWYLAVDEVLKENVVHSTTTTSHIAIYYCVGFFIFECFFLYSSNIIFRTFDPALFAHHTLALIGYSIAMYYNNKVHFFAVVGLLEEMSTPFTCLCWMLLKAKMTSSIIWKTNQLILIHLFHCRTMLEGYFFYMTYWQWDIVWNEMPLPLFLCLYIQVSLQFFILTPYWTYKKTNQLFDPIDFNHPKLQQQSSKVGDNINKSVLTGNGHIKEN